MSDFAETKKMIRTLGPKETFGEYELSQNLKAFYSCEASVIGSIKFLGRFDDFEVRPVDFRGNAEKLVPLRGPQI